MYKSIKELAIVIAYAVATSLVLIVLIAIATAGKTSNQPKTFMESCMATASVDACRLELQLKAQGRNDLSAPELDVMINNLSAAMKYR